jgi:hypothetical protein
MPTIVRLPDDLSRRLQRKAARLNLSVEDYVLALVADVVPDHDPTWLSLEEVVASIRAIPRDPSGYQPPSASLRDLLSAAEFEPKIDESIWNSDWAVIEQGMKARDLIADQCEGRP